MRPSKQQLQNVANTFNLAYQPGDSVKVQRIGNDPGSTFIDVIEQGAFVMGGHTVMVMLKGKRSWDASFVVGKAT